MRQFHPHQSRKTIVEKTTQAAKAAKTALHPVLLVQATFGKKATNRAILSQGHFVNAPQRQPVQTKPLFRGLSHELVSESSQKPPIQAKLAIGQPDDLYEREADLAAVEVGNRINLSQNQETLSGESPEIRNSPLQISKLPRTMNRNSVTSDRQEGGATFDLESSIRNAKGQGRLLPKSVRETMEQIFGKDFSQVMVHANAQSDELNQTIQARAFTTGQDIFFRQGMYDPDSKIGQKLIAHELTHVVQQNGDVVQRAPQKENAKSEMELNGLEENLSDRDGDLSPETLEQLFAAGQDIDELPLSDQEQLDEAEMNNEEEIDEAESIVQPALFLQRARVSYFNSPYARFARAKRQVQNVGGRNIASARVLVNGIVQYVTKKSKGKHSEKRLYDAILILRNLHGAANVIVQWIYTELQPCGADNHNCKHRLRNWFPGVPIHYSIKYPSSKVGVSRAAAKRRRKRAVGTLKRFGTRLRQGAPAPNNANSFKPTLRRVNSDPNLSPGYTL